MAVAGAPRIVTQTATNLRVSNETETGFVQQASTGLSNIKFDGEEIYVLADRIIVRSIEANGINALKLYDYDLDLLSTVNIANSGEWTLSFNELDGLFIAYGKSVAISMGNQSYLLSADRNSISASLAPTGLGQGAGGNGVMRAAASPDGSSIAQVLQNGQRRFHNRIDRYQWQQIVPTGSAPSGTGSIVEWSSDSRYILIGSGSQLVVCTKDGLSYTYRDTVEVANVGQTLHRVSISPDNVFLAASTSEDDGGLTVYRTRLYKRSGDDFYPIDTIDNFGGTLSWNEEGDQLYDALGRRAFRRTVNTNTFTELVGFMTNIPAGVQESATSPHIEFPVGAVTLYDTVLHEIITGTQALTGLKLALLDENYVFDSATATATVILAANEVSGAHWPVGGKELLNVQFEPYGLRGTFLTADTIEQMIYEGSISARFALIYDPVANVPFAYVDFQQEIIAEQNSKLTLRIGDYGLILITP